MGHIDAVSSRPPRQNVVSRRKPRRLIKYTLSSALAAPTCHALLPVTNGEACCADGGQPPPPPVAPRTNGDKRPPPDGRRWTAGRATDGPAGRDGNGAGTGPVAAGMWPVCGGNGRHSWAESRLAELAFPKWNRSMFVTDEAYNLGSNCGQMQHSFGIV